MTTVPHHHPLPFRSWLSRRLDRTYGHFLFSNEPVIWSQTQTVEHFESRLKHKITSDYCPWPDIRSHNNFWAFQTMTDHHLSCRSVREIIESWPINQRWLRTKISGDNWSWFSVWAIPNYSDSRRDQPSYMTDHTIRSRFRSQAWQLIITRSFGSRVEMT